MTVFLIVLKVILWILLAVLGIIIIACVLPISGKVSYIDGKFAYKAAYSYVTLIDSKGGGLINRLRKRKKKPEKDDDSDSSDDVEIEEVPEMSEHSDTPENPQENSSVENNIGDSDNIPENDDTQDDIPEDDEDFIGFDEDEDYDDDDENSSGKSLSDKIEFILDIWRAADRPLLKIFKGFHLNDIYIDFIIADEDAYKCAMKYGTISGTVYNLLAWLGALFTIQFKTVDINAGFDLKESRWDASAKVKFRLGTLVIAGIWFLITYLFRIYIPNKTSAKKAAAETAE